MMSMIKSTIEGIPVEMTVEETIGSTMGGYPTLYIGLQSIMVKEVDTLEVYKAVATSGTVEEFCEGFKVLGKLGNTNVQLRPVH